MPHDPDRPAHLPTFRLSSWLQALAAPSLLFAVLASPGCMVGPDYVKPEAKVASDWQESADPRVSSASSTHADWWRGFEDPILDELIYRAYEQNLDLQQAGIRVLQARAQLGIAVGQSFPQVQQFSANYTREEVSKNLSDPPPSRTYNDYSTGLDATWELDFWGQFARNTRAANATLLSTVADYDSVLVTLTGDVASNYISIRAFEQQALLARQDIESQRGVLSLTQNQFENGAVSELDVVQALTRLSQSQALVPQLQIELRQTKNALCVLLGEPPHSLDEVLGRGSDFPRSPQEVAAGVPADLLLRRPDVRAAERTAAAQAERIGIAEANLYPHFSIAASGGWEAANTGDLLKRSSWTASGGGGFQWDIFNYGRLRNDVRVEDALFQQSVLQYQNIVLQAAAEVEDALIGFLMEQDRATFLTVATEASKRSLTLSLSQYREGTANYTRVLDAQSSLFEAQQDLVQSQANEILNLIAAYKALGGGWQLREGHDFVPESTRKEMAERTNWGDMLSTDYSEGSDLGHPRPDPDELYPAIEAGTQP